MQGAGRSPRILIVGAGAGGLCTAMQLRRAGVDDFTIVEKSDELGGTWHDNTYPGAACDVPSHLYSFSFAPKADWTRKFPAQSEILDYLKECARRYGLGPHLRLGTEVRAMRWSDATCRWHVTLSSGEELDVDLVVSGTGQLNRPFVPEIDGLETFGGTVFHSARWNHDHDLTGERVAVVGNAASAVQFVPEIAPKCAHLTIFQRSANWVMPKPDRPYAEWERRLYQRFPLALKASRFSVFARFETRFGVMRSGSRLGRLIERLAGRELRKLARPELPEAALVPDYPPGCKRLLISNNWYQTLLRPNVSVELDPIARIEPGAVVTRGGRRREVDTLVFGTGFQTTGFLMPMQVTGRGGQLLHDRWATGALALRGICVPGFPNLFILYGPNTNLGHNSILFMIESQVGYVLQCVADMVETDTAALEATEEALERYRERLDHDLAGSVWAGTCGSWYKNAEGRITNNWSGTATAYRRSVAHPDFSEFRRLVPVVEPVG